MGPQAAAQCFMPTGYQKQLTGPRLLRQERGTLPGCGGLAEAAATSQCHLWGPYLRVKLPVGHVQKARYPTYPPPALAYKLPELTRPKKGRATYVQGPVCFTLVEWGQETDIEFHRQFHFLHT